MPAVLTHKPRSIYDDRPWEHYHFPRTYLRQVEHAVGDFIVYYEPRREGVGDAVIGGRQAYVAAARLERIRPDPARSGHFYADVSHYIEFDRPVPFREGRKFYEQALRKDDGSTNRGAFGRSVRPISRAELEAIVRAGFAHDLGSGADLAMAGSGLAEPIGPEFVHEDDSPRRPPADRLLTSRAFRDRAFAGAVQRAYGNTCALTGLRILNGGGRAEAEAAHIRPVEDDGPDTIRNGLALSGTIHWMFDRGLVSIAPDGTILTKPTTVPESILGLLNRDGRARLPTQPWLRPSPLFLDYHRQRHGF